MGVQGLLGLLEEAVHDVHISELRGRRVAVDGYCWLHKATYSCALELCTSEATDRFLGFCGAMLDMLEHFGVAPLVVLDGGPLPSKAGQEDLRRRRRDENQRKGREALAAGSRAAAVAHFQRAVDVTPRMAAMFEALLRWRGVPFIVAPFEADAQLAFLQTTGAVDWLQNIIAHSRQTPAHVGYSPARRTARSTISRMPSSAPMPLRSPA